MATPESFFTRLTRLFRSGPAIQRRIKGYDTRSNYNSQLIQGNYGYRASAPFGFGRENSPFSVLGSYGILDRMARYAEFSEMEYTPEIATALDIYSDETVGGDDRGKSFHIYSRNSEVKKALDDLFYDVLNVEFNLKSWTRNLVKYGDFFLYNEVYPDVGIINVTPIAVNEIEREEGFDIEDPYAVRFKWLTRGNKYLENWQVSHFRIMGNDLFLPFGTSILEPARRIWRQLIMYEDAMLTYRVVRSPERRVFYIDVGNVAPNDVPSYMEAAKAALRSRGNIDRDTGREDQRFNAQTILDDYFVPVRGAQQGTRIETLSAGQNVTATEDVEYIQKKLFAAIKVPKPYMNFDENLSAKASLAAMDVRFSRTIQGLQKILIAELNKLAMIHLFSKGFDGPDLVDFELKLSNPSSIALQQRLELWQTKFDIGGTAKETQLVDELWIQKNILELSKEEIDDINSGRRHDRLREMEIESLEPIPDSGTEPRKTTDMFDPTQYSMSGEDVPKKPAEDENVNDKAEITMSHYDDEDDEINYFANLEPGKTPIKPTPFLSRHKKNRTRRMGAGRGRDNTAMPNLSAMLSPKNKYTKDVYGQKTEAVSRGEQEFVDGNKTAEDLFDYRISIEPNHGREMKSVFANLESAIKIKREEASNNLLNEELEIELENEEILISKENDDLLLENISLVEEEKSENNDVETIEERSLTEVFKEDS